MLSIYFARHLMVAGLVLLPWAAAHAAEPPLTLETAVQARPGARAAT